MATPTDPEISPLSFARVRFRGWALLPLIVLLASAGPVFAAAPIASYLQDKIEVAAQAGFTAQSPAGISALSDKFLEFRDSGHVRVQVHALPGGDDLNALSQKIETLGGVENLVCKPIGCVESWVPIDSLGALADLGGVSHIGLPRRGVTRAGSVTTEGDVILTANQARTDFGLSGAGVKIGVISDGVETMATPQGTGDLPGTIFVGSAGSDDEGTAMLEIIHDLAPGATLGFSEGLSSDATFINSIGILQNTFGADIIVDDIAFFLEPYLEDGPVALAAQAAVDAGVAFFSAVGNESDEHYEADFNSTAAPFGTFSGTVHDFGGGDVFMNLPTIFDGEFVTVFLQWNDPFDAPVSTYRMLLFDKTTPGTPVAVSFNYSALLGGGLRSAVFTNHENQTGMTKDFFLVVERVSGSADRFEILGLPSNHEYPDREGSVFGHPAASGVQAVGAINIGEPGHDMVEAFSQVGPGEMFFPSHEVRAKPEFCAMDGVSVTGAGFFPSTFLGTSAAAPHAAAIGALVLEKNGGPGALTPAQMSNVMRGSAVDIESAGIDNFSGSGRLDANAAVQFPAFAGVRVWEPYD